MRRFLCLKKQSIFRLIVIITYLTAASPVWAEFPLGFRYDLLNAKLTKQYKAGAFRRLLNTIEEIKELGGPRKDAMLYYEGVALWQTGKPNKAKTCLEAYLRKAGHKGDYSQEADKLLITVCEKIEKRKTDIAGIEFVYIHPGTYMMGSPAHESERGADEKQQQATLTQGFYLQTTEVTQEQWKAIMGNKPSQFKDCGDTCPVENVSWYDAQKFIEKLNQLEKTNKYRLPSEVEWEYACRAGGSGKFAHGDDESKLQEYAWYKDNSEKRTHRVAQKKPNAWGLYDMHGNVWEWCQDWYQKTPSSTLTKKDQTDPPDSGAYRVNRGGGWGLAANSVRCADRSNFLPGIRYSGIGFRLLKMP